MRNRKKWGLVALLLLAVLGLAGICGLQMIYLHGQWIPEPEISANHNDPTNIRMEIFSPDFRPLLARAADVSEWRARYLRIEYKADSRMIQLSRGVNQKLADAVSWYLSMRSEGHSAAYCRDVMGVDGMISHQKSECFETMAHDLEQIPKQWIFHSETIPVANGGSGKRVVILDGEIGWEYFVRYRADGVFENASVERFDGIELAPRYQNVIGEVEDRIKERMESEKIKGLGACHSYWSMKREMLLEKGIRWRSPSELNPHTMYD